MKVSNPVIYNLTLTNAATEYSQVLSSSTESITIQARTLVDLQLSFIVGNSGTLYITIPAGSSYTFNMGWTGTRTIYLQSPQAGAIVEILEWS